MLGPFEVETCTGPVELSPRLRTLVALLVERRGKSVTSETLIDELWGEATIPTAAKTLQGYVTRLRKSLGADAILSRHGSYAMPTPGLRFDAAVFELAVAELQVEAESAQQVVIAQRIEAMWRGSPYEDVGRAPVLEQAVRRLNETRHRLLTIRMAAQTTVDPYAAVADLEMMVSADPIREEMWVLLVSALHRTGRRADALAATSRARRVLAVELGVEPGAALRRIEALVLSGELADVSSSSGHGAGQQHVRESAGGPSPASARPPDDTQAVGRFQRPFVGRKRELAVGAELLQRCARGESLVMLVQGEAGVGKTAFVTRLIDTLERSAGTAIIGRNESSLLREYGAVADLLEQVHALCPTTADRRITTAGSGRTEGVDRRMA